MYFNVCPLLSALLPMHTHTLIRVVGPQMCSSPGRGSMTDSAYIPRKKSSHSFLVKNLYIGCDSNWLFRMHFVATSLARCRHEQLLCENFYLTSSTLSNIVCENFYVKATIMCKNVWDKRFIGLSLPKKLVPPPPLYNVVSMFFRGKGNLSRPLQHCLGGKWKVSHYFCTGL